MKRVRETSSLKLLPLSVLLIVVVLMACGSDDSVVSSGDGDGDMPKVIRLIPSETIFTADDLKAIGWKPQKDLFYDYEGTEVSKWGFLNSKEVGVLIYATAEIIDDIDEVCEALVNIGSKGRTLSADERQAMKGGMTKTAEKRVLLRFTPQRYVSWDHAKLGGKY